jgi:hypothetical protein
VNVPCKCLTDFANTCTKTKDNKHSTC